MANPTAATIIGKVDLPPYQVGASAVPPEATAFIVEFTIQAADYSSGLTAVQILAAINGITAQTGAAVSAVVGVSVISVRIAAGTGLFGFGFFTAATGLVRFFTAITNQTTATDYTAANGDIWRLLVIAI